MREIHCKELPTHSGNSLVLLDLRGEGDIRFVTVKMPRNICLLEGGYHVWVGLEATS